VNWVETKGKTIEEAVHHALSELNCTEEDVDVEVLEESSKGFLGILKSKEAKVRVTLKPKSVTPLDQIVEFLLKVIHFMGVDAEIETVEEEDNIILTVVGDNLGVVIGRRGETLDALQYLASLIANRHFENGEYKRILLDAEGYRSRREKTLIRLALKLCEKVKKTGRRVVLEPMNPQERRVIHTALQNETAIQTLSEGEDPFRRIVISPKRAAIAKNKEGSYVSRR
jgi:spoIIIJ-associated protein